MKQMLNQLTAITLLLVLFSLPAPLLAREKRGANLAVTLKDGHKVTGELIAVKPDSLLMLGLDGKDESVVFADIATIRIVRRSKAWQGLLYGFVPGALGGAILASRGHNDAGVLWVIIGGLVVGAESGLVGFAAGVGAGLDTEISLTGLHESALSKILAKLSRQAREPREFVPTQRVTMTGGQEKGVPYSDKRGPRLKLTWAPGINAGQDLWDSTEEDITFRFTEDLPPAELGPYTSRVYVENLRSSFSLGRISLAYEWSRRLSSEIELHISRHKTNRFGDLVFNSTLDGIEYWAIWGEDETLNSLSLLAGLTFRPLPPDLLQHHVIEAGVAAGPAWISASATGWLMPEPTRISREMTWTARARVAYDYYFNPAFSMGAFAEYRWLRADIPSYTTSAYWLDFHESDDYYGNVLNRVAEVTVPERTIPMGGFACGLRFGFCF
ncbi:MAG: hypothetical protein MUQ25_00495 [Candidatus Aminicenantes bacterium]|nr:hypothetical protein [Candidatus Aminicenantes bacterium]